MGLLITDELLGDIDLAKARINEKKREDFVKLMLLDLSNQVSEQAVKLDEDNAQRGKEVLDNYKKAWCYGIRTFGGDVEIPLLGDIVGILEPDIRTRGQKFADIRTGSASLNIDGQPYSPPVDRERVVASLDRLFSFTKNFELHPLEEAVLYNLHITRIQPFQNGNKRLSSIIMNVVLNANGYFPIHLKSQETGIFKEYVGKAIRGFQEASSSAENPMFPYKNPDQSQRELFSFLARRERNELISAEDYLKGLPSYDLEFKRSDNPNSLYFLKKKIDGMFRSSGRPHQCRLNIQNRTLEVIGEVSMGRIEEIVSKVRSIHKYKIKANGVH